MKVDVLGVKIDALPKGEVLRQIAERLGRGEQTFIVTPYSESIVAAQRDAGFRAILNSADFTLPDGVGVLWAAHFARLEIKGLRFKRAEVLSQLIYSLISIIFNPKSIRDPIPEKISGAEFVWDLAGLAAKQNKSVYLLGGFGDTSQRAGERLQQKFPGLRIAGTYSPLPQSLPPLGPELEAEGPGEGKKKNSSSPQGGGGGGEGGELIEIINSSGADFLFAALGPKRQEKWIYENRLKLAPKVLIGLGGTFDYLAGKRPYRPQFWALRGLEWLWRLLTQPWRAGRVLKGVFGLIYYTAKSR